MNEENQGLTLLEALECYSEPVAWREYQEFKPFYCSIFITIIDGPPTADQLMTDRAREMRRQLEADLIAKLVDGVLTGTAYVSPLGANSERVSISRAKWKLLDVKFDDSTAAGYGLQLFDIRIREQQLAKLDRGRKTERLSQNQEIHEAFAHLIELGKVRFVRGGLTAAADELASRFSAYKPDSIRKLIQPAYNAAKQTNKPPEK